MMPKISETPYARKSKVQKTRGGLCLNQLLGAIKKSKMFSIVELHCTWWNAKR